MKVEIYSDIACPWCYVGMRRFERALAAFPDAGRVEIVYRPYQLDPTEPEQPSPLLEALARKYGGLQARAMRNEIVEVGKREGIDFRIESALAVNTLLGHRLLWLAEREYGSKIQATLKDLLFRAYFTEGGNVGDRNLLAELAARAGMDRHRAAAFLASDEGASEVRDQLGATQAIGVTAVPTFVFEGKWRVQGVQAASAFLRALERADEGTPEDAMAEGCDGDHGCADGICNV